MACILLNPQDNFTRRSHMSQHAVVAIQLDCVATKRLKAVIISINCISFLNFSYPFPIGILFVSFIKFLVWRSQDIPKWRGFPRRFTLPQELVEGRRTSGKAKLTAQLQSQELIHQCRRSYHTLTWHEEWSESLALGFKVILTWFESIILIYLNYSYFILDIWIFRWIYYACHSRDPVAPNQWKKITTAWCNR